MLLIFVWNTIQNKVSHHFVMVWLLLFSAFLSSCSPIVKTMIVKPLASSESSSPKIPTIQSFNASLSNSTQPTSVVNLSVLKVGQMTHFCILINDSDSNYCNWIESTEFPSSFDLNLQNFEGQITLTAFAKKGIDGEVSAPMVSNSFDLDLLAPLLPSVTILNSNPTNSTIYTFNHEEVVGTYSHYCILENDTVLDHCVWIPGLLPSQYSVNSINNSKFLSFWLMDSAGNFSERVESNSVTLDNAAPILSSASIINPIPSTDRRYNLNIGSIDGDYSDYCMLENNTSLGSCTWISGTISHSFYVSRIKNDKVISIWLKDQLGNVSTRVDTNAVAYQPFEHRKLISSGGAHVCGLNENGSVSCWGDGSNGQLGNGSTGNSGFPVNVSGISGATAVVSGGSFSCAQFSDNYVMCWGNRSQFGVGGFGIVSTPMYVPTLAGVRSLALGYSHSCAVYTDNTVKCWGANWQGQLGNGTTNSSTTPVLVSGITNAETVYVGEDSSCAVLLDGTIKCWGGNNSGKLGNGNTTNSNVPVVVSGISNAMEVHCGRGHTCARLDNGDVKCWGAVGMLGVSPVPAGAHSLFPLLSGVSAAVGISGGFNYTCALLSNGMVKCWGDQINGELGNGLTGYGSVLAPVQVSGLSNGISISGSGNHICAVLQDGSARCWGSNWAGQTGIGSMGAQINRPIPFYGLLEIADFGIGGEHGCYLSTGGSVRCWGGGSNGKIGNGSNQNQSIPTYVMSSVKKISSGWGNTCVIKLNGTVQCWGEGANGILGNGSTANSSTPVTVTGINNAKEISVSSEHACAVLIDGTISCWGNNSYGQLGDQTTINRTSPVTVVGINNAVGVSMGIFHTCALITDGSVRCWGKGQFGALGNGSVSDSIESVQVSGISSAVMISSAYGRNCALLNTGSIRCWGFGSSGELGNGGNVDSSIPVPVSGISNAASIMLGGNHACALLKTGKVYCWGRNDNSQLGNGTNTLSNIPVPVVDLGSAIAIKSSNTVSCAILTNRSARCWGQTMNGFMITSEPAKIYDGKAQVVGFDRDSSSPLTSISANPFVQADGTSVSTITVQLTSSTGQRIVGTVPVVQVIVGNSESISPVCTPSDSLGVSTCNITSTFAELKKVWLTSPVLTSSATLANGNIEFFSSDPNLIEIIGPESIPQNTCSGAYSLSLMDGNHNVTAATSSFTVNLDSMGMATLYADPQCTLTIPNSFIFDTGNSSHVFYLKNPAAETLNISINSGGYVPNGNFQLISNP